MAVQIAANRTRIEELLADGYVLVLVRGWWWLLNGKRTPIIANCGSVNSLLRDADVELIESRTESWEKP